MGTQLQRRQFLKLMLITGVAAGCRQASSGDPATRVNETLLSPSPDSPLTLSLDLRFQLENQAVDYKRHPDGCDHTVIWGTVRDAGGHGLPGIVVQVWAEDGSWAETLITDAEGAYQVTVAEGVSEKVFLLQLRDQAGTTLLSDVTVAPAIPRCELNLMIVNFVATH